MKITPKYKPELLASNDNSRASLSNIFVEPRPNGHAMVATNGRMIGIFPVEVDDAQELGPYTTESVKKLRGKRKPKGKGQAISDSIPIEVEGVITHDSIIIPTKFGSEVHSRPTVKNVPKFDQALTSATGPVLATIGLNAEYLAAIQKALGSEGVELRIRGPQSIIEVVPHGRESRNDSAIAYLMPRLT